MVIDEHDERIAKIAMVHGWDYQVGQLYEEMGELAKAVNKLQRFETYPVLYTDKNDYDSYDNTKEMLLDNILEEIEDVEIVIATIKWFIEYYYMHTGKSIADEKIDRELKRIEFIREAKKNGRYK